MAWCRRVARIEKMREMRILEELEEVLKEVLKEQLKELRADKGSSEFVYWLVLVL